MCPGHAGAVGPSPPNLQHQQIGAETESSGCPRHPQVLRLHQWETEIPQLLCLRSVFSHSAEKPASPVVTTRTHFRGFVLSDKDSKSVSGSIHQQHVWDSRTFSKFLLCAIPGQAGYSHFPVRWQRWRGRRWRWHSPSGCGTTARTHEIGESDLLQHQKTGVLSNVSCGDRKLRYLSVLFISVVF